MKTLITLAVVLLVGLGIWWGARDNEPGIPATGSVEGVQDVENIETENESLDPGEYEDKG